MKSDSGQYLLDDAEKLLKNLTEEMNTLKCSILGHYVLYGCCKHLKQAELIIFSICL